MFTSQINPFVSNLTNLVYKITLMPQSPNQAPILANGICLATLLTYGNDLMNIENINILSNTLIELSKGVTIYLYLS